MKIRFTFTLTQDQARRCDYLLRQKYHNHTASLEKLIEVAILEVMAEQAQEESDDAMRKLNEELS